MITTVIPVKNGEKWIANAIESFLIQKGDKELIVIDKSEHNKVADVVKKYNSDLIKYVHDPEIDKEAVRRFCPKDRNPDIYGIFSACNLGLQMAKGDIFHTMADDHELTAGTYETVEREIGNNSWLLGNVVLLNENRVELRTNIYPKFDLLEYRRGNILAGCACFVRTSFLREKRLEFNQKYPLNGDYDFYLRLANLSQPKQIVEPVIKIMLKPSGLTSYGNNEELRNQDKAEIIANVKKEFPLPNYLETERPKVLVAVCNEGWIRPEVTNALIKIALDSRVDKKIVYPNSRPYENNLSHIANKVRREMWDYLLIIDCDNPPTKNPLDLCFLNLDIVGCPTPQWNEVDSFPIYWVAMDKVKGGWKPHKSTSGLQEVDAVGTGCMLIHRRVLESLQAPFTRKWNKDGTMNTGVDFNFCQKAKEKGFKIYAHYDYPCDHFKELSLIKVLEFKNRT